ncbi:MobV family relaxase [Vibrio parahaemolyticus]|uniref:MobV family relaxase n=1 Tax=Vibrio parahaemolyticus TaxID=670 RepID=UPI002570A28C|nr:MobV family relaxase [Vibrio parahaemolyticus]WJE02896.1 MobV family relaxase [Vibrio parahaemolyticus]
MNKTILRFEKIKTFEALNLANAHANRFIETPNADPSKTKLNKKLFGATNIVGATKKRLKENGIKPRKGAVIAIDGLMTVSPEFFKTKNDIVVFANTAKKYLKETFKDNLISVHLHLDETSPHIHFCTLPITEDGRLSARDLFNKITLKKHQKLYCEYLNNNIGKKFEYKEGSKAEHTTIKEYYTKVNEEVSPIKKENEKLKSDLSKLQNELIDEEDKSFKLEKQVEELQKEVRILKKVIEKLKGFVEQLKSKVIFLNTEKKKKEEEKREDTVKPNLNPFDFPDVDEKLKKELLQSKPARRNKNRL